MADAEFMIKDEHTWQLTPTHHNLQSQVHSFLLYTHFSLFPYYLFMTLLTIAGASRFNSGFTSSRKGCPVKIMSTAPHLEALHQLLNFWCREIPASVPGHCNQECLLIIGPSHSSCRCMHTPLLQTSEPFLLSKLQKDKCVQSFTRILTFSWLWFNETCLEWQQDLHQHSSAPPFPQLPAQHEIKGQWG